MATAENRNRRSLAFIDDDHASDSRNAREFLRNVGEDLENASRVLESLKARSRRERYLSPTAPMPGEPQETELVPCNAAAPIPNIFTPSSSVLSRQAEPTAGAEYYSSTSDLIPLAERRIGCPRLCEKCRRLGVRLLGGKAVNSDGELMQPPTLARPGTAVPSKRESVRPPASLQQLARTQSHIPQPGDVDSAFEKLQSFRRSLVVGTCSHSNSSGVAVQQVNEGVPRRETPRLQRF